MAYHKVFLLSVAESYAVRFIPKEAGVHYVQITMDGTHMPDSPFRLRVGGKEETDPTAVTASGLGIKSGETGQSKQTYYVPFVSHISSVAPDRCITKVSKKH